MKMNKKILITITSVVIILNILVSNVFATNICTIFFNTSNITPKREEEVEVTISVKDITKSIAICKVFLNYDNTKLDLLEKKELNNWQSMSVEGMYTFTFIEGTTTNGDICKFRFKVKSNAEIGDTTITFKDIQIATSEGNEIVTLDNLEQKITIKEKNDDNGNQQDNNNQNDNNGNNENQQDNNNQNDNNGNNENQQENNNQNDNNGNNENQQDNNNQNDNNGNNENQQENNNQNDNNGNNENQQDNNNQNNNDGNNENQQDNNNQNNNDGNNGNQQDNNSQNIKIIKAYDNTQDNTKSSKTLPKTGKTQVIILGSILVFAVLAVVFYKNSQKYKGI